jgi:pyridinium-3,5-bisthiocarboxylic acid mononucleotide nickel chelatase
MNFLLIDCSYSGISGDLLLSSLVDLSQNSKIHQYITNVLNLILAQKGSSVEFVDMISHGINGKYLKLNILNPVSSHNSKESKNKSDDNLHFIEINKESENKSNIPIKNETHHHYDVKSLKNDLEKALSITEFPEIAKKTAHNALDLLIRAESDVHNIPLEDVKLHEIGAIDTIIDISGSIFALNELGVFKSMENYTKIYFPSIAIGGGTIKCAHGILPVPAPATTKIIESENLIISNGPENFELATPTGVSILASLKKSGRAEQIPDQKYLNDISYSINGVGIGVGSLKLKSQPNILRSFLCTIKNVSDDDSSSIELSNDQIYVLETNVDDVKGEILGNLFENLMEIGALDVNLISTITKKNRPGYLITVLTKKVHISTISNKLFKETGTLGIRVSRRQRIILHREILNRKIHIYGEEFNIRQKIARDENNLIIQSKFEFDDIKMIANKLDRSIREIELELGKNIKLT